jgi:hypothetical protein
MPRDLRYTPKLPGEIDELAKVTNDDLIHAQETATQLAAPKLNDLLAGTEDDQVRE